MADDDIINAIGFASGDLTDFKNRSPSDLLLEDLQISAYRSTGRIANEVLQQRSIQRQQMKKKLIEKLMQINSSLLPQEDQKAKNDALNKVVTMMEVGKPPTPYQDPDQYFLIKQLEDHIKEALKEAGTQQFMANANYPLIGTMPTGNVNAQTYCVPDSSDYLVVFEDQLFTFCNMFSKVIASALPFKQIQRWHKEWKDGMIWDETQVNSEMNKLQESLLKQNEILYHFLDLIESYLISGTPGASKQYLLEGPYDSLAFILLRSMELFAIGHEYGHIFRGDLMEGKVVASLVGRKSVGKIVYSWEKEFLADEMGLKLMLWSRQRVVSELAITKWNWEKIQDALSLFYWGPALFFSSMDIIDRAKKILNTGTPPPALEQEEAPTVTSHPHPLLRRDKMIEMIAKNYKDEAYPAGLVLTAILDVLWASTVPFLVDLYRKGKRPHVRWQL
jgi:hypothetical protein